MSVQGNCTFVPKWWNPYARKLPYPASGLLTLTHIRTPERFREVECDVPRGPARHQAIIAFRACILPFDRGVGDLARLAHCLLANGIDARAAVVWSLTGNG